ADRLHGRSVVLSLAVAVGLAAIAPRAGATPSRTLLAPTTAEFDQPLESIVTQGNETDPPCIDGAIAACAECDSDDPGEDSDTCVGPMATTAAADARTRSRGQAVTESRVEPGAGSYSSVRARGPPTSRRHSRFTLASNYVANGFPAVAAGAAGRHCSTDILVRALHRIAR